MLKFSGFADLTSCLGGKARMAIEIKALPASKTTEMASETLTELLVADKPLYAKCVRGKKLRKALTP